MTTVVLDASAPIAMLKGEHGARAGAEAISDSKISAVNCAEVISHFIHAACLLRK